MYNPNSENILFLDIETVPQTASFTQLSPEMQQLWEEKTAMLKLKNENQTADELYEQNGGIYSEFGKIICISVGFFYKKDGITRFREKSFYDSNEKILLQQFAALIDRFIIGEQTICGHNIKEFDIPYICRRMIINNIQLPKPLQIAGKKPWEVPFIDTLELWRFGDFKNYTSLKLLTAILNIPTPKDDIDGSQVASVFYKEKNIERIVFYCEKDVLATARLW